VKGGGAVPGAIFRHGVQVDAKSEGQLKYLQEIDQNDIVFAIGPAGTGKTFLAVMKAVEQLKAGRIRRIVLVRPAVEAGERLGFLPGDIQAKVNPYLRPIYDSLNTFLEFGQLQRLITSDVVEICPLAYMRGRTLDEAFIILDEAQNTTSEQMKMFLTRMGRSSKIVVTGDITPDRPDPRQAGAGSSRSRNSSRACPESRSRT
jgi:phosphate starvation-inducible PhoH-like protein